jgi:AraC-like DNA-binding protein
MKTIPYRNIMSDSFPFTIQNKMNSALDIASHAHEYLQICYVIKGTCIHNVHGKKTTLVKGDLFSIPPMYEHRLERIPDQEVEVIHIDFLPSMLDRNMSGLLDMEGFVDFAFIQPFVQFQDTLLPKLNLSFHGQRATEQLIFEMMEEFIKKQDGYPLIIKSNLQKLLVIAGREFLQYSQNDREHQMVHLHRKHFEQALTYIDQNYSNHLKLHEVAAQAAMSPSYFSTVFKLIKGMTFIDYVNETRLNEALRLLECHPDWSVEYICEHIGFNHLTHFYRMFKRKTGKTPGEIRKESQRLTP